MGDARRIAQGIRRRVLEYTLKNNGGYLSQACSAAEILAALYTKVMRLGPVSEPLVPGRFRGVPGAGSPGYQRGNLYHGKRAPHLDRFFLSPTHYSLVLYAALVETGRMAACGLEEFNKDGGGVEMIGAEHSPGMEVMTGSLGQAISQAAGIALGRRLKGETGRVWVFMSDGEMQIGQVWEAMQAIAFHKLDNVGIYVDINGSQCDGLTREVMCVEPLERRFEAFGCQTVRVNGHDLRALARAGQRRAQGRPLVVLCDTEPWHGLEMLKARAPRFHYIRFPDPAEKARFEAALEAMSEHARA